MRVIVIGAGRGRRLMPTTADAPKCFAEVAGKRLLDWALDAFAANGLDRVCFIGGYQIDKVQSRLSAVHVPPQRRLGAQQHPGVAVLRRGPDGRAVHLLLQRRAVHAGRHRAAGGVAGRHGAGRRHRLARALRAADRSSARRRRKGDRRERPRDAHPPPDSRTARRTASTSAWPSSRPPAPLGCASTTTVRQAEFAGQPWREARSLRKGVQDPAVSGHDRSRASGSRTSTRRAATSKSIRSRISSTLAQHWTHQAPQER